MANSKNNIYPIQLQGAELCLNRYDAEIKQYRGFNKNNSPFVGGCLSNVFTKEEQIEGATDENTYIDTNGDVYKVDTEGLYRNDEKIISLNNRYKFYENIEIKTDFNTVKVFNEKILLNRSFGQIDQSAAEYVRFRLKINDVEDFENILMCFSPDDNDLENTIEDALKNNIQCILASYHVNGILHNFIVIMGVSKDVSDTTKSKINIFVVDADTMQITHKSSFTVNHVVLETEPISICFISSMGPNNLSLYYSWENTSKKYQEVIFMTLDVATGEVSNIHEGGNVIGNISGLSDNKLAVSTDLADYKVLSHPYNELILKNIPENNVTSNTNFRFYKSLLYLEWANNTTTTFGWSKTGRTFSTLYGRTVKNLDQEYNFANGTLTPLFGVFDYQICYSFNSSEISGSYCFNSCFDVAFNFFEHKTVYIPNIPTETFSKCRNVMGCFLKADDYYPASLSGDFGYLFNNNQLSGIAGKFVLFTEWNTVDPYSITYYKLFSNSSFAEKIYYQCNGKWFVLREGTPKLKRVSNQIVINVDYSQNSFDLLNKRVLFYAPGFNGVHTSGNMNEVPYPLVNNNLSFAGAINEYEREKNASIILNPVNVYYPYGAHNDFGKDFSNFNSRIDYPVNLYTDIDHPGTVSYLKTLKGSYNPDLAGMLFPTNADGNIEYSPCIFSEIKNAYGNHLFIKNGESYYPLSIGNNSKPVMSFYIASGVDNFEEGFIIQGQFYGILYDCIYNLNYNNGVVISQDFVVSVKNLQFVGNTPYEALFFSKTNRCLYSFTGANVLNQKQLVDKISEVRNYLYNPATQTVFLITDIGVLFYGLFGMFLLEYTDISNIFLLDNGIVMSDNSGNYRYIKYYLDEGDTDYTKENIRLETCFYGMNNEVVTINDCLYFRLFNEEHEEGDLKVSATTISLRGRKTEETTFKIKASDWDKITHTIYLRYQPKTQRGLGVAFAIDSPFKIASLSIGSQPDAVLVDKVSKGAITTPSVTTNNNEW